MQKKYRRMLIMLVYILVVSSTIAYSALTSSLQLNAEAKLRTISDIRVTGISLSSANGGTLQYESSYDVNTITSGFVLPTTDSSITYKVTVTNNGTIDQTIYDILTQSSNNSGLYYEISGYNVRDVIGFKTVVEFYITYKTTTPSEEPINVVNKFNFKKVYHVTFETKGGTSITDGIKYEGVDLDLSTFTSTKQGYILSGWTDEQDGTTVKYQTNGTYTLDRDLILYAVWEGNPNTSYSVNHYVHDLGANTYTLDSTDNLTGTTDSTLTLASLKKTIPGFTYVDGYLTGGTTKPTEGAVTTTTVLADGSRVINLYYRRNYLYIQYDMNGGSQFSTHGESWGTSGSLVTYTGNTISTKFLRGVYDSKVGSVNTNTYVINTSGLDNYNYSNGMNVYKDGYKGKSYLQWNTKADGTGTSYYQDGSDYDANGFGGADLSAGDQVVTLYVNWVPVNYEIMYDLQGGTLSTTNPATYNIETNTFTLNNPTQVGYTFTGWTGSNGNTPQTIVTIPVGSTGDKAYIANWQANTYTVTVDANGGSIPTTTGWTGTGATATKSVTYDSPYGTLPTPTRNGYTFKGWNGKNLINVYDHNETFTNNYYWEIMPKNPKYELKADVTYTLSHDYVVNSTNKPIFPSIGYGITGFSKDIKQGSNYSNSGKSVTTFTTPSEFQTTPHNIALRFVRTSTRGDADVDISNIQLEEGSVATPYEPYYVTNTVNVTQAKDHTLKAIWEKKEATFLPGQEFNAKIKQLAGNQDATYETEDSNITSIVRTNTLSIMPTDENVVSTSDSEYPIYAWFDSNNGTIYYYTEALNPYMNSNSGNMFRNLKNLTSLDLSEFDTKYTTYMHAMFYNCLKLSSLNISNFDTSNVISMIYMFYNCTALTSVDVSNFNTTSVRSMSHMFRYAGLQSLDISSFDMSNVTNTANMLTNMTSLKSLKTPKVYPTDSNIKMTLPKLMVDASGNEYTELDNTSPTETMLYTPATFLQGSQFNIKLKKLANSTLDNITAYTVDTNITVIQRSNTLPSGFVPTSDNTISTSDSYYPIYAWFDNGTIYYYTEALKPYTNEDMYHMFYNFGSIETIDLSGISTKKTTNMSTVFGNCNNLHTITLDNNFDSSNVTTMSYMFYNSPITTIDLTKINTSKVTNMSYMFAYTHIANPNLNSFNTSNVEDMSYMFYSNVYSSTMTFGSNFVTSKVSNMEGMFGQCTYLTSLDLSGFNTSNVVNMSKMFYNVSRNTTISLNLNNFNTSKVTNMGQMFFYTQLTSLDISSFDMSLVTDTTSMFTGVNTITELKTPKVYPSEAVIQMSRTLYDPSGNSWSVLDTSAPTETWLKLEYIPYSITYNLGGGTASPANPTSYNINSSSITLNNPTRAGYTFAGWSGGKEIKQGLPSDTAAANTTSRTFTAPSLVKGLAFNNYYYPSNVSSYSINNNSINIVGRSGYGVGFALLCEPNTDYTISYTSTVGEGASPVVGITYYAQDGSLIKYRVNQRDGNQSLTTTSTSDSYYVVISFGVNSTNFASITYSNISLSGTTDTIPYEGYVDKQTTITIPSGSVGNRKYTANWTANSYTVTADANGGSIPSTTGWTGTGNTATKSVTYDSQYGTLPTPTRNGYTFKGWNGKNLLNINIAETTINGLIASVNNNLIRIEGENTNHSNDYALVSQKEDLPQLRNGTRYTLSTYNKSTSESYIQLNYFKENDQTQYPLIRVESGVGTFTVYNDYFKTYAFFIGIKKTVTSIDEEFRIQLEEGTAATPYEPYYVTSSTNVTQDKNHTLKAKWEMNTYEITYDLQGGTLASSNPATYNVETNTFTLNNPTLTGQTFIGWTGSNGNTPEVNVTIPVGSYGDKAYVANFSPIYEPETRIRSLNTIGTTIADDDPDSNLRFIGANPNNYVSFNGQKWRIIGVFDGKLKIIGDSIGNYSWDTSRNTVNNGYGVNQWGVSGTYTGADLMKLLNPGYSTNTDLKCNTTVTITDGVANCGDNTDSNYTTGLVNNSLYWNASSGYCYNYGNYKTTSCDFSTSGLQSDTTRNMIDNATWYLGSNLASDNIWDGRMTASYLYNIERSNNTGKQCSGGDYCNDDVTRTTTWQGKVGLLYPSDYIYATGGGSTYNRNTCLTVHAGSVSDNSVSNWNNTYTDCKNNDWLLPSSWTWSLSPRALSSGSYGVFFVDAAGIVSNSNALNAGSVRPVVYLKSSIKLTSGDGSYNSPFNLIDTE